MGMNIEKMRKDRERHEGGLFWQPPEGDSLIYILPPHPEDPDQVSYVEHGVHWNVGRQGQHAACLDQRNPALVHPKVKQWIQKLKINVTGGCPICQKIADEDLWNTDRDQASGLNYKARFAWLIIPMGFRRTSKDDWTDTPASQRKVRPWICAKTQWDAIGDIFYDEGDITDPTKAVLVRINREGKGLKTQYAISADTKTLKAPLALPKELRAMISKAHVDPELNTYKIVAQDIKPRDEVESMLNGIAVEPAAQEAAGGSVLKECFGDSELHDPNDTECKACEHLEACAKAIDAKAAGDAPAEEADGANGAGDGDTETVEAEPESTPEPEPEPAKPSKAELARQKAAGATPAPKPNTTPPAAAAAKDGNLARLDALLKAKSGAPARTKG